MTDQMKKHVGPLDYKRFAFTALGHWDKADPDDDEYTIAAPSRAAAEKFLKSYKLYNFMDPSTPLLYETGNMRVHITVDKVGDATNGDAWHLFRELEALTGPHMVHDVAGRRVINPGDGFGKTWLFKFLDRDTRQMQEIIVEAASAEKVLDAVADHPMAYALSINQFDKDSHEFANYRGPGSPLPGSAYHITIGCWLMLDGGISPDQYRKKKCREPYPASNGMYWPSAVHDNELFWDIVGAEGADVPYPTHYKLPNGSIIEPKSLADPPECYTCSDEARDQFKSATIPDVLFCSQKCVDYAESTFVLRIQTPRGKKTHKPRIYGPIQGLPAVRALVDELADLPPYNAMDDDFAEEIVLRPLSELKE